MTDLTDKEVSWLIHRLIGDTATLISQISEDPQPNGLRYRVTLRKK